MTPDQILDQIAELSQAAPFTAPSTQQVLGGSLEQTGGTDYFAYYTATDVPAFDQVKLMQAKPRATKGGRVALRLREGPCIEVAQARERFGMAHKKPVHPGHPAPSLEYWTHDPEWGELLMGYDPETGCLVEVTLQAGEPPGP